MTTARVAFRLCISLSLLAACSDSSGPDVGAPASLTLVSGDAQSGVVASALAAPLVVRVSDEDGGAVSGAAVAFSVTAGGGSVEPLTTATAADGTAQAIWTLGTRTADTQTARATLQTEAGARTVTFRATPAPGAPTRVVISGGNSQSRPPAVPLRDSLAVVVSDAHDNPVRDVAVRWTVTAGGGTISPPVSVTNASGVARARWTLGDNLGAQAALATVDGAGTADFAATAVPPPVITSVSPAPLVAGGTATLSGDNFSATGDNAVDFGGTPAQVLQATTTQLTVRVPCMLAGVSSINVTANGVTAQVTHPVAAQSALSLAVGQSALLPAGEVCGEMIAAGRYVVAVANGNIGAGAASFRLRGTATDAVTTAAITPPSVRVGTQHVRPSVRLELPELRQRREHARLLEQNLDLIRRLGPPPRGLRPQAPAAATGAGSAQIAVNDTLTLKIPNANGNLCSTQATVRARVVYAGNRGIILEDVNAPLAGKTDSLFRALGDEFETVQWPILTANFGDPLAFDAQTDANGRVFMLFSRVVNDFGGVAGFVSSGNYYPPGLCAASNQAEIFYGVVPTDSSGGYGNGTNNTRENWNRAVRSLLIHEVKHITSFAERFSRNGASAPFLEESWLEESTAVAAEELFARTIFGYGQNQNTSFQASLFCERRPNNASYPECRHKPFIMYGYFAYLYDYLANIEDRTPTRAVDDEDFTFYGSGWFLLRWAADHFGGSESAFFRALVQDNTRRGIANLEARTGRSFTELLADWALAIAIDDRPGLAAVEPVHTIASWNTRDIFSRIHGELGTAFPAEFPLAPHLLDFGTFSVDIASLRSGTAAVFELAGNAVGQQLLHLTAASGTGAPDPGVRLKLARIE